MVDNQLSVNSLEMKTTTQIVDEEYEFLRDKVYLETERYERETQLMQELFESQVKIVIGNVRKRRKLLHYARVTTRAKLPRFIRVQSNNRGIQATANTWNRSESSIRTGMPF